MTRIRIVFVVMALVLLGLMALVIGTAFDTVAKERSRHHRVVADRIVDEMEGELTAWLRREEDRPYAQYRYFYVPEGSPEQLVNLIRSPLSDPPQESFLICYFQIDADGSVSSPLWPDNEELAAIATNWRPSSEIRAVVDLVDEAVRDFWGTEVALLAGSGLAETTRGKTAILEEEQLADTALGDVSATGETGNLKNRVELDERTVKQASANQNGRGKKGKGDSLSYLSRLNRGADGRRQRPTKVEPSQAANVYNFLQKEANVLQGAAQTQAEAVASNLGNEIQRLESELLATTPEIREDISDTLEADGSATIDVRLKPMVGRLATSNHLVIYRTVSIGEKIYRQGMMLDIRALVRWAAKRVLADSELAARASISVVDQSSEKNVDETTYRHRFAEPFAAVRADVTLAPLPEVQRPVNLTSLSLLLAAAATLGLFALYRMVAVVVAYAERRNNFVSAVTHELKTPLTAIRMYSEMLRDGIVPDEGKRQQYYETITAETERLTRLVQNVLELSQLEQKTRAMKIVVGDVESVAREVLEVLRPHAEKEGFSLELRADPELPQVRFDRDALIQVLFNLVDNALKYSRRATHKAIVLSCRQQGEGVVLAVSDHGPGVARRQLEKIFEPFYRAEDELTRTSRGTGIGLALVQGLVERMGGSVRGRNSQHGGFEVEIQLSTT